MAKRYSITTPIYYVNSAPHIGTALTTLAADICKRHREMQGEQAWFLTGTDENGTKVMEAAQAQGREPMEFVSEISDRFVKIWREMGLEYDDFIRTTEPRHFEAVGRFFEILRDKGHIYRDTYSGWYDVGSETWYTGKELVDGKSPDGNEVRWVEEDNWFFRLTAFAEPLLAHIDEHPEFIVPAARRNEVVSFIKGGLRDVCISRVNPGWGVPVPGDPDRVVYVWFDALINYVAATGWPNSPGWEDLWPADVQWMGKDILTRFHATLWPAMLLGVGLPLPKHLVGHGWLLMQGGKMSKSKGNVVAPQELAEQCAERSGIPLPMAVDAVRHYMAAVMPFESDAVFTPEGFDAKWNSDLANDIGGVFNRLLSISKRFGDGVITSAEPEPELVEGIERCRAAYDQAMEDLRIDRAVASALDLAKFLHRYVDGRAPWSMAKAEDPALPAVLRGLVLGLRSMEALIRPHMPAAAAAMAAQMGLPAITEWRMVGSLESAPAGAALGDALPLFPRLEPLPASEEEPQPEPRPEPKPAKKKAPAMPEAPEEIEFSDFIKVSLKVARILEAEEVPKSSKLLKLRVKVGEETRQILAGIKGAYAPEDLIGRQVVIAANLKPRTMMGELSQGMVLAADDEDGSPILLMPDREAPEGTNVH
jgi:methionyl-tRNA synthetase